MGSADMVAERDEDTGGQMRDENQGLGQGKGALSAPHGSTEYRRYREVAGWEAAAEAGAGPVKWSGVKGLRRAVEKAVRAYRNDASRLLDIVRQSLVFEDLQSLMRCLESIGFDPEVQLVQIKNRMDPSYDSARTAGYRDVCVSMRLLTPAAVAAGAWGHVCEVQLMLLSVARVKTAEGHKRYVAFRDIRGE